MEATSHLISVLRAGTCEQRQQSGSSLVDLQPIEVDHRQFVLEITRQEQRVRAKRAAAAEEDFHFNHGSSIGASER